MTPEERAVIEAARNAELHPSTYDGHAELIAALNALPCDECRKVDAQTSDDVGYPVTGNYCPDPGCPRHPATEEPQWVPRPLEDVRTGDLVRLPTAPDLHARVVFALPGDWHVRSGGDGHRGRFDDVPLEHRKVSVRLDYPGVQRDTWNKPKPMKLPAGTPVEISLTASELQAIELLGGFEHRVRMEAGQ